jgi:hypothetical protein
MGFIHGRGGSGEAARILIRSRMYCARNVQCRRVLSVHAGRGFIQRQLVMQRKLPYSRTLTVQSMSQIRNPHSRRAVKSNRRRP